MNRRLNILGLITLFALSAQSLDEFVGENSIGKRQEYLDSNGKYLVEWEAYTDTQTIIFDLTVETTGYVGFGISPVGGMTGADIIIGGVHPNGTEYFSVKFFVFLLDCQFELYEISNSQLLIESSRSRESYA